ncbi:MAG: NotI family restriction endonuclease [Chloroflexota bacterium]
MPRHPLAEVFGFPTSNFSAEAKRHRARRLCPYNNKVPNCTKDKAKNPLGVCSVLEDDRAVITCPVRFRQEWVIADDTASFFFSPDASWTSLTEVRLPDKHGRSAGNIDVVLVAYDKHGQVIDFGALEVQAVYISGNIRNAFEYYMQDPAERHSMTWEGPYYPRPDYLSSSRKRLAPQLIYKGGILNQWGKKLSVVVDRHFFSSLPPLPETTPEEADIAWLVYDLTVDQAQNRYRLTKDRVVYTAFSPALETITRAEAGSVDAFMEHLQHKLDEKLENGYPPDAPTLADFVEEE